MTEQNKQLLLRDICARLPYDIKIDYEGRIYYLNEINPACKHINYISVLIQEEDRNSCATDVQIDEIKPYLRPMSSMTEEEMKEYNNAVQEDIRQIEYVSKVHEGLKNKVSMYRSVDYLNSHHFDYRGLIEKDLALKAPKGMYKID